jgi:hypothetical protein
MATNALATAAAAWLGYTQILTAAGIALLICVPLLLLKDRGAEPVQA